MKRRYINFSWPATLSDFSADEQQGNFTRGKLKVFYKGETADHRYFSDEFSEEVIKTLPYTPVVSYYDEEKDDFVGHATEQQVYGMVDPCVEPSFVEDEDGKSWCVCDVVLYTERPDKVGEIAKKIVGHTQSLELDPNTVKYTINYDERRHFKNIEFTAGRFVGVSVLGSDQKPAFTGSEFFSYDEKFQEKMELLKNYCETKNDQKSGGDQMNLKEFMTLSWGDISSKVDEAITAEYSEEAFVYVIDMFNDSAIVRWYSYIDGSSKLMRIHYTADDNGVITLGNVNEVHIAYEDIEPAKEEVAKEEGTGVEQATEIESELESSDIETTESIENAEVVSEPVAETEPENLAEDKKATQEDDEDKDEDKESGDPDDEEDDDEDKHEDFVADAACGTEVADEAAQVLDAEVTQDTEKVSEKDESQPEEEGAGSASFAESERAELEALKREKKVNLINSYKETLTTDQFNDFNARVDESTYDQIELELLKIYKENQTNTKPERAFSFVSFLPKNKETNDSLDNWVKNNI